MTTPIRFYTNNFLGAGVQVSAPGQYSATFPVANIYDKRRSLKWFDTASGYYKVTSTNNKIYLTKSAVDYTATVAVGEYTSATLITAINAAISATGISGVTIATYDTEPFHYQFESTGSDVTLRISVTTDAAWSTLGYTGSANRTGATLIAEEARQHTALRFVWDFGVNRAPTFFAAIAAIDEVFPLSSDGTYKIMANGVDSWSSPPLSFTITHSDSGLFQHLDSVDTSYRFWCFEVYDPKNAAFVNGLPPQSLGYLYLGDHLTFTSTNIATKFTKAYRDNSTESVSDGQVGYYGLRPKQRELSSCAVQYPTAAERLAIEQMVHDTGIDGRFFVSLDPGLAVSTTDDEYTFYAQWDRMPDFRHVIRDLYIINFALREAI